MKVDALGRVVVPIALRKKYGIQAGDRLKFIDDGEIRLEKVDIRCLRCGAREGLRAVTATQHLCLRCLEKLQTD